MKYTSKLILNWTEYEFGAGGGGGWQPWANTIAYYTLNNDGTNHSSLVSKLSDITLSTAQYSTTKAHWNNTHSLYCDGSTKAYIPASALHEFGTNDLTISMWVYSLTNSWTYPWIVSCYAGNSWMAIRQWWRISDRMANTNQANFCWNAWAVDQWDIWVDWWSWISIYDDGWHNIVLSRINWVINLYLDWNTTPIWSDNTHTTNNIWRNADINLGYNLADNFYSTVYLNDLIIENKWWTAQEVADYYNATA